MYSALLILLILDAIVLMAIVLLQAGKGGGLAAMGAAGGAGSDSLFGSRQAATLLTRATWWTGGIFLGLSFILSLMTGGPAQPEPILRGGVQQTAPATRLPEVVQPAPIGGETAPEAGAPAPGEPGQ